MGGLVEAGMGADGYNDLGLANFRTLGASPVACGLEREEYTLGPARRDNASWPSDLRIADRQSKR